MNRTHLCTFITRIAPLRLKSSREAADEQRSAACSVQAIKAE
jgi:hypothetical protein